MCTERDIAECVEHAKEQEGVVSEEIDKGDQGVDSGVEEEQSVAVIKGKRRTRLGVGAKCVIYYKDRNEGEFGNVIHMLVKYDPNVDWVKLGDGVFKVRDWRVFMVVERLEKGEYVHIQCPRSFSDCMMRSAMKPFLKEHYLMRNENRMPGDNSVWVMRSFRRNQERASGYLWVECEDLERCCLYKYGWDLGQIEQLKGDAAKFVSCHARPGLYHFLNMKFPVRPFGPSAPPSQVDCEVRAAAVRYYMKVARIRNIPACFKRRCLGWLSVVPWASENDKRYAAMNL